MHLLPISFCVFALLFFSFSSSSEQNIYRLSTSEGLSQANVVDIVQDKLGYVWISTEQGLNRYDGVEVSLPRQIKHLFNEQILHIKLIDDDYLFVSTGYDGSYLINTKTLVSKKIYSGQLSDSANFTSPISAVIKIQNDLYAGIDNQLYKISLLSFESELIGSVDSGHQIRTFLLFNETLFIGSTDGLYSMPTDLKVLSKRDFIKSDKKNIYNQNVKLIKYDNELGLLLGTVEGLYAIPYVDSRFLYKDTTTLIPSLNIWGHELTSQGEFIATEKGLFEVNRLSRKAEFILSLSQSSFKTNHPSITSLELDLNNVLWMGTHEGAYYWPLNSIKFRNIRNRGREPLSNSVWGIHQLNDKSILYGTDNGFAHLSSIKDTEKVEYYFQSKNRKEPYGSHTVYNIFQLDSQENDVFLETAKGLRIFNLLTKEVSRLNLETENKDDPFERPSTSFLPLDKENIIFIGLTDYNIYNTKYNKINIVNGLSEKIPVKNTYRFLKPLPTLPNHILISSMQGLDAYNLETSELISINNFPHDTEAGSRFIENWEIVGETLWLTTSKNGLITLNLKDFSLINTLKESFGIKEEPIYEVLADPFGYLWITAQTGLFRLELDSGIVNKYTTDNGLPSNEFNAGSSFKFNNQFFLFGTNSGITWIDTADFIDNAGLVKSSLNITDINIMSVNFDFYPDFLNEKQLTLAHDDIGLEIKFSNFDFTNQRTSNFSAELTGSENIFLNNLSEKKLFFPRLPPGNYDLTIKELSLDGGFVIEEISFPINGDYYFINSPFSW